MHIVYPESLAFMRVSRVLQGRLRNPSLVKAAVFDLWRGTGQTTIALSDVVARVSRLVAEAGPGPGAGGVHEAALLPHLREFTRKLGDSVLVRYDPRNLSKVWVAGSDERNHAIRYSDLTLGRVSTPDRSSESMNRKALKDGLHKTER